MTEPDTKIYEEMKRYLFHELTEEERQVLEDRFFDDEAWFYELMDLDDDLVDRYVRGELRGRELTRFERSLDKVPERRQKVANAAALRKFISEERAPASIQAPILKSAPQPGWREKLASLLTLKIPVAQFAGVSLILFISFVSIVFLIFSRLPSVGVDVANLGQENRTAEFRQKEEALQKQLNDTRERERLLETQLENERGQTDILNEQLERERAERGRLINELDRLRREKDKQPIDIPSKPVIASIVLTPFSGSKGAGGGAIRNVEIGTQTAKINATLQIPKESTAESYTVRLGALTLAENLKPQKTKSGYKFITVSLTRNQLAADKDNVISISADDGDKYNYVFRIVK